jgi:hypothetical protein
LGALVCFVFMGMHALAILIVIRRHGGELPAIVATTVADFEPARPALGWRGLLCR